MRSAESLATKHRGEKQQEVEVRQGTRVTDDPAEGSTGEPVNTAALAAAGSPSSQEVLEGSSLCESPRG